MIASHVSEKKTLTRPFHFGCLKKLEVPDHVVLFRKWGLGAFGLYSVSYPLKRHGLAATTKLPGGKTFVLALQLRVHPF